MTPSPLNFEQALTRLEEIVDRMERGDLSLEESLALFEEGIGLSRQCIQRLDAAEQQIQKLVHLEDGKFILEPWGHADDPKKIETPEER